MSVLNAFSICLMNMIDRPYCTTDTDLSDVTHFDYTIISGESLNNLSIPIVSRVVVDIDVNYCSSGKNRFSVI